MNDLRTYGSICAETVPSLRTPIISRLRCTRDPVAHERLSLLAAQLKEGAPARYIARQVELIGGGR